MIITSLNQRTVLLWCPQLIQSFFFKSNVCIEVCIKTIHIHIHTLKKSIRRLFFKKKV